MNKKKVWILILISIACNGNSNTPKNPAIKQVAPNYGSLAEKANFLYKNQKFAQALECYDTLIRFDSAKGGYYFKRGYCKSMMFNFNGAITDYKKAIDHNFSEKSNAYSNIGALYDLSLHKYDSAIYYYNKSLELDPNNKKAQFGKIDAIKSLKQLP